jgi:signal transduction histidine kinase
MLKSGVVGRGALEQISLFQDVSTGRDEAWTRRETSARRKYHKELSEFAQLRTLFDRLLAMREEERRRVAGEVHDVLGTSLTAVKYRIEDVIERIKNGCGSPDMLHSIIPIVQNAIRESERIQWDLRPPVLDDFGLITALSSLCRKIEAGRPKTRICEKFILDESDIPDALKSVIYRFFREAAEISSQSGTEVIRTLLERKQQAIELTVRYQGRELDPGDLHCEAAAFGQLRETADLSGGNFRVTSTPDRGTTLRVRWPIRFAS